MIGQKSLLRMIEDKIEDNTFPRFCIIDGVEGSGKKTLVKAIAVGLECQLIFIEPKVDSIRELIKKANTLRDTTLYVIKDGNISTSAKNALLKVCEEPPNNAYIVMLTSHLNTVEDTLKSRAWLFHMEPYTYSELSDYAWDVRENYPNSDIFIDLCEVPGDIDKLFSVDANKLYDFVVTVIDNIAEVSTANALKIANSIDVRGNDDSKFDLVLFLRMFKMVCGKNMREAVSNKDVPMKNRYADGIRVVSNILNQLTISGINKGALLDIFILNIREEWS